MAERVGSVIRVTAAETPLSDLFRVLDLTGVFANAVLGAVIARSMRLDLIGPAVRSEQSDSSYR